MIFIGPDPWLLIVGAVIVAVAAVIWQVFPHATDHGSGRSD